MPETSANYVELSADIVSAYVSKNAITRGDLPALIASVHSALSNAANATGRKGGAGAACVGQEIDHSQSSHQHGGWTALQVAEAAPHGAGPHPGAVSGEMVAALRLPNGRAELFQGSIRDGEGHWPRSVS